MCFYPRQIALGMKSLIDPKYVMGLFAIFVFVLITSIPFAYFNHLGRTGLNIQYALWSGHVLSTLSVSMLFATWLVCVISWFGMFLYFLKVLRSRKPEASFSNASPLNSFYVFSKDYLNEEGLIARSKFFAFFAGFFVTVFLGGGSAMGVAILANAF